MDSTGQCSIIFPHYPRPPFQHTDLQHTATHFVGTQTHPDTDTIYSETSLFSPEPSISTAFSTTVQTFSLFIVGIDRYKDTSLHANRPTHRDTSAGACTQPSTETEIPADQQCGELSKSHGTHRLAGPFPTATKAACSELQLPSEENQGCSVSLRLSKQVLL